MDNPDQTTSPYVRPAPEAHRRWAALVKQVYEVDPLECPECGNAMVIVAFIRDPVVVHRILAHLGLLESSGDAPPRGPPDSGRHYEPVYDDLPPGDELLPAD